MSELEVFCRQVRERSQENRSAMGVLHFATLFGQAVGVLRQELDSMVRVMYLLSIDDRARRAKLVSDAVHGKIWQRETSGRVTDREMVDLANRLHGWARSVYRFGCAFIHLSSFHDYKERDPVLALDEQERADMLYHLRYYHGGPASERFTFLDLGPYLPSVFEKIASNLECYLARLEKDERLDDHDFPRQSPTSPVVPTTK